MYKKCTILLLLIQVSMSFSQVNTKVFDSLIKNSKPEKILSYLHKTLKNSKETYNEELEVFSLNKLGHHYLYSHDLDSSKYYLKKAKKLYTKLEDNENLFLVLQAWNKAENLGGYFNNAIDLSHEAIKIAKQIQNGAMLSDAYQQKATIYLDKGNYNNALEQLIMASKALDTLKNKKPLKEGIIKVGIGRTETLRNNYEDAIPYLEEGIKIFENLKHNKWLAISYMELGNTHYDLKNYNQSLLIYNKGLKISETMQWDNFIAPYMANIGAIYLEKKEYDKALDYFFSSNKISSKHGSINNQIIHLNDVASAYFGKADYKKAINYYTKTINLADSIGSIDNLSDAYLERSETYEKLNQSTLALKDYKKYHTLNDSVFNSEKSKQIEALKIEYETEKKEQHIVLQNKEIDLLKQQEKNNNLQRLLLGIGLLLALIGFYAVKQKLKRKKLEKEKLDAELEFKKKELTTHALHLAKKNEVLDNLKQQAKQLKSEQNNSGYQHLIRTIDFDLQDDKNWENFSDYFQQVHKDFNTKVKQKYPTISASELRLMSLLKMNLTSKEIANILNISPEGIKKARYRLRKKLDINTEDSLQDLILSL